jgi:heat shock protein HslJ/membrane-bound inhibitor of C-type lysozyme
METAKARVAILAMAIMLSACSEDTPMTEKSTTAVTTLPVLEGTVWQVEDIDSGGIIDRSMITMDFSEGGRILGFTGCNRYFGDANVARDALSLGGIGSTRRACAPALMGQEQRFLNALNDSARFAIDKDTWLVVYDAAGVERLRAIGIDSDPTAKQPEPQDIGSGRRIGFDCEAKGAISFRFVGPETIELTADDVTRVLTRKRSASGARYTASGVEFWNKGDEALLTIGEEPFICKRR